VNPRTDGFVIDAHNAGPKSELVSSQESNDGINTMNERPASETRPPKSESDLRFWLENMAWYHRYSIDEMSNVTDLPADEIEKSLTRLRILPERRPVRTRGDRLRVLPYPGGRHPRIGFLDGAVNPQRDTKFSVFAPWDDTSYAVVDLPEAIWSNLGLTYLAHTHVPTIWSALGTELRKLEWKRSRDGSLTSERTLPNGIAFGATVVPGTAGVAMELWLKNGTMEQLSDLRIQNCVMLKGMAGFEQQTNDNKVFDTPFVACHNSDGSRWIITAWERCFHAWGNAPCPCLHSDPKFPDCAPGKTVRLHGWVSFYEGRDIELELLRLKKCLPLAKDTL